MIDNMKLSSVAARAESHRHRYSGRVRLSVIVPGYNATDAQWTRCVRSIIAATSDADEIILVDDGSRDGAPIVDSFGCRVIHKANGGLGSARNCGLDAARGKYVTFVDCDDEVTADVYECALAELKKSDADVCLFGVKIVWTDLEVSKIDAPATESLGVLAPADVARFSRACLFNYACNKVYRAGFLSRQKLRFEVEGVPCEDVIFNLQVVMRGATWCSVSCVGYYYYREGITILSAYKKTIRRGMSLCQQTWNYYRQMSGADWDSSLNRYRVSEADIVRSEWADRWRPGAPRGWSVKWGFLKKNAQYFPKPLLLVFLKQAVRTFLRKHCYFKWIRRRMIFRTYPHAARTKGKRVIGRGIDAILLAFDRTRRHAVLQRRRTDV